MLSSLFRWIYCLDIPVLLLMLTAASTLLAWSYIRYHDRIWLKPTIGGLLFISTASILTVTLLLRIGSAAVQQALLIPFNSYRKVLAGGNRELLRSNFMNVVLFYPAGLFSALLLPGKWHPVLRVLLIGLLFAVVSAGIERAQFMYILGQPDVDDIIHNTLGAVIGGSVGCFILSRRSK